MANLRILYDNVADRAATLTANTEAGALLVGNLLTERKGEVHRTTGTTAVITATWAAAQTFNMVALAFGNYTPAATMKVQVFTNTADVVPALDTGDQVASGYTPYVANGGTLGVNGFPYGAFVYGRSYFAATAGKKLVITVTDAGNPSGYLEAARLIAGQYWSPASNAAFGPQLQIKSNVQPRRSDAGDLRTERRPVTRSLRLDLTRIQSDADRDRIFSILRGNGGAISAFLSLFPQDASAAREHAYQIYGKLSDSAMTHPSVGLYTAPVEIEEL